MNSNDDLLELDALRSRSSEELADVLEVLSSEELADVLEVLSREERREARRLVFKALRKLTENSR